MVNNLQYQLITEKIISQPPLRTGVILLKLRGLGPHRAVGMVEVVLRQTLLNTPGFTISSSAKLIVSLPDHRRASPTSDIWRASHRNI